MAEQNVTISYDLEIQGHKVKVIIGKTGTAALGYDFIEAWKRAENGDTTMTRVYAFESFEMLAQRYAEMMIAQE